jgi:hypothetical protein
MFNAPGLADFGQQFAPLGTGADYGNGSFFGNPSIVANLNKALGDGTSMATSTSPTGPYGVNLLIPQSLESTLQIISFKLQNLKLWQRIAKKTAKSTVEEFNKLDSYGSDEHMWMGEGALPNVDNSVYERDFQRISYLGTQRAITHPATLVNVIDGVQPLIDEQDRNGTMQLLRVVEQSLFSGDTRIDPLSIMGIQQQLEMSAYAKSNILDLRGKPLTDTIMEEIDNRSADVYGGISVMYMDNRQKNMLSQLAYSNKRFQVGNANQEGDTNLGLPVKAYVGNNSTFDLENHQFIRGNQSFDPTVVPAQNTPLAPTSPTGVVTTNAVLSQWASTDATTTCSYYIVPENSYGPGAGLLINIGAVLLNQVVALNWTDSTGGKMYKIYRKDDSTNSQWFLVSRVAAGAGSYVDANQNMPGCSKAYGLYLDADEGMCVKMLAPLFKLAFAQIDTSIRWGILMYPMLMIYQIQKQFLVKNVGWKGSGIDPVGAGYTRPTFY